MSRSLSGFFTFLLFFCICGVLWADESFENAATRAVEQYEYQHGQTVEVSTDQSGWVAQSAANDQQPSVSPQSSDAQQASDLSQAKDTDQVKQAYVARNETYFVSTVSPAMRKKHAFDMSYEMYDYEYRETVAGDFFMKTKGGYAGIYASYTFRPDLKSSYVNDYINMYRVEGRYASGTVDYTGSGTFEGLDDYTYELRGLMGKDLFPFNAFRVTPYAGFGYRYLNNGLEKYQPGGYNRESEYSYLPVGAEVEGVFPGKWSLGMTMEYDHFITGTQTSHNEDLGSGLDPLENTQDRGYGLRASVSVRKDMPKFALSVEPFVRYWNIEDSDIKPITSGGEETGWGGLEPSNTTKEIGLRLGMQF